MCGVLVDDGGQVLDSIIDNLAVVCTRISTSTCMYGCSVFIMPHIIAYVSTVVKRYYSDEPFMQ